LAKKRQQDGEYPPTACFFNLRTVYFSNRFGTDVRKEFFLGIFIVIVLASATTWIYLSILDIQKPFPPIRENSITASGLTKKNTIYMGVVSRYPPPVIYQGYQPLMDYLTENSNYKFEIKLSLSYDETVEQLVNHEVEAAFLGSYVYVGAHDKFGVKCILKPLSENSEPFFHSVIITKRESSIQSIKDIRGKRVALPSQQSFTTNWFLFYELKQHNIKQNELHSIHNFSHHQTVISQVLKGNFDVGVVREQVAKDYSKFGIRIIAKSYPIAGSPIVVSKNFNPKVVDAIKTALLKINVNDINDRKKVESWDKEFAYGFVVASDSDYQHIRKLIPNKRGK
jgi:phosphonate transport system substrate-binding protein